MTEYKIHAIVSRKNNGKNIYKEGNICPQKGEKVRKLDVYKKNTSVVIEFSQCPLSDFQQKSL